MNRLIDADSAIIEIERFAGYLDDDMILRLQIAIKRLPTIDAAPVVRCKDCRYWDERTTNKKGFVVCSATHMDCTEDDYCSFGEKVNRMKKFLVLSRCGPEYHRIVEAEDISEVADHYHGSCYGIIEILQDEVTGGKS